MSNVNVLSRFLSNNLATLVLPPIVFLFVIAFAPLLGKQPLEIGSRFLIASVLVGKIIDLTLPQDP